MIRGEPTKEPLVDHSPMVLKYPAIPRRARAYWSNCSGARLRPQDGQSDFTGRSLARRADPQQVQIVPPGLQEEVERAKAARPKGWLRLLSGEILGRRFEANGLKLIGTAQWQLRDWDGAVVTWERIRALSANDVDANLALANVFERQSRVPARPADQRDRLLTSSDQALERVLGCSSTRARDRKRSQSKGAPKTHWREVGEATDQNERRRSPQRRDRSYEGYLQHSGDLQF